MGVMSSALVGLDDYVARSEYGMGWRFMMGSISLTGCF